MSQTSRISGARLWLCTAVLVVAVLAAFRSMTTVVQSGPWVGTGVMGLLLLALLLVLLRVVLRSPLAPTAWGILASVLGVAGQYGGLTSTFSIPRPTAETLERLRLLIAQGEQTIVEGRIPVQPTRGLEMLLVVGVLATYLGAELVAVGLGRGGLAGLPLLALWSPAVSYERDVGIPLLLVGGTTYVLLLALTRRRPRRNDLTWRREATTALTAAAAVTVGALALGSMASALPFAGSMELPSSWGEQNTDSPLRLSTDLDMRANLDGRSNRPLLEYTGSARSIGALRTYTLATFDGEEWQRGARSTGLVPANGLLWPDQAETSEEPLIVDVRVLALEGDRLPVPAEPRAVTADGVWLYDATRDEIIGSDTSVRGLDYELTISPRELSADTLQADAAGAPPEGAALYLDVPATQHSADISALAQEIVAGAGTTYDQAIALQSYLRSSQNFAYDTELAAPQTDDAVWDFLTSGRGYCVQFATAMTLMARMVGIPARMAIGFLPGSPDEDRRDTYVVSARQAHAWPELYFADAGWVRFEPTPAQQTGAPPIYADPFAPDPQASANVPTSSAMPTTAPTTGPGGQVAEREGYVGIGDAEVPVAAFAGVTGGVAVLLVGLALVLWHRRRRKRSVPHGPEEWWARLREDLAEHGIRWTDATTPRQAAHLVRSARTRPALTSPGEPVPEAALLADADAALDRLVAAVEADRYSPRPSGAGAEDLAAWVAAVERPLAAVGAAVDEA
ncbi:transglutaminase family protein [Actinotalea fermentans]|uniref:Transglutaminase n=1 Tax=Actinotalea fermentans TaxID=43671 RepID=A0A511YVN2_9CELL|nr:transglutaminaseTgpA domain-containing protein [Actinotalea fermentans]KGM17367.1 hypothetical protein N867_04815 [Actinotalea fermentans ATCC 43279 = JCM 9966 = DSM 3133]GEN79247.1 transglutaminase [Actinotalea fermentans]